jgi:hypothetical protein
MDGTAATDSTDTDALATLSEVLRLVTALADQVLAEIVAGRAIGKDQSEALSTAVGGLRKQGVTLPPSLEQTIQEISLRATEVIKRAQGSTPRSVSWTFGGFHGHQRIVLAKPKPSPISWKRRCRRGPGRS